MIKLIATDMDGTLFYPKERIRGIPKCNQKFLEKYLNDGGKLVLVSGRNVKVIPNVEKQLKNKVCLIGCNGAYVKDENGIKENQPLDRETLVKFYSEVFNNYSFWMWWLFDEHSFIIYKWHDVPNKLFNFIFRFGNNFRFYFKENFILDKQMFMNKISTSDVYKLMLITGMGKEGEKAANETAYALKMRFGDKFEIVPSDNAIEITAKGVNKGVTLEKYCNDLGIKKEEVIVCGDSGNDLAMFAKFPHTFAMSHSLENFKNQANHIIDRVSDVEKFVYHEELMKDDKIKDIDFEKTIEKNDD